MSQETADRDLKEIVNTLNELTVLKLARLKTMLEEEWGVQAAAAAVAVAAAPGGAAAPAAAAEESTEFDVIIASCDPAKKIGIIKVVREATGLGLKEAKDIVDALPKTIKEKASKKDAEEMKKKIEEAGGKVELKGV
ncbi:MAG: 50S ribosomal protein L7/L12 [Verrucomicrobia bacterium]|nr:50S ribosomal protein L7/L12 [Verrucomicrobiota bacterium]